jgi:hypothetical protein
VLEPAIRACQGPLDSLDQLWWEVEEFTLQKLENAMDQGFSSREMVTGHLPGHFWI